MILLISTCKEKLHELEFVKPAEKIVGKCFIRKYSEVSSEDLEKASKIIICGTSLKDNDYLENLNKFEWIKYFDKPILGICAGSHIIQFIFGGIKENIKEIGEIKINFEKKFLGLGGEIKVYVLHQNFVNCPDFEVYGKSKKCVHAVKHRKKEIYGVLFHPEVYNSELISEFLVQ